MAIVSKTEDGKTIYKYQELDEETLYNKISGLLEVCKVFIDAYPNLQWTDIALDFPALAETIIRVDKRKDYFTIYHDKTEINEAKEAALLAYWIMKFRPFTSQRNLDKRCQHLNEKVAIFILLSAIKEEANCTAGKRFQISLDYANKLSYAFRYWDISKEALMLIAESLRESVKYE